MYLKITFKINNINLKFYKFIQYNNNIYAGNHKNKKFEIKYSYFLNDIIIF